jgi:branched-chain amino acid transport system substrate-binding protein
MLKQVILSFLSTILISFTLHADNETVKIGALLCLSGDCAETGQNALNGAMLAVEEINNSGGILKRKVELVVEDTQEQASPANSVSAYQKLKMQSNINYLIGPSWTIGALPIAPIIAKDSNVVITAPSVGVADFNETSANIFNIWPHDSIATKKLARFALSKNFKRATIFSNQNPWESAQAKIFNDEFKRLGGEVELLLEPLASTRDLKSEVLKIKQVNPDFVFFSNYTQMDIASIELKRQKYQGQILAILMDETRLKNSRGALQGAIFADYPPATEMFKNNYYNKYKVKAGIASNTGYDVIKMYALAFEKANSFDVQKVLPIYKSLEYNGASGFIKFDEKGGVQKKPWLYVVKDSKVEVFSKE